MGMKIRASAELSSRTLNYQQTTNNWTAQNISVNDVTLSKHSYSTLEFDFGLFVRW